MASWESLVAFAITLPETEESLWYGTAALKVRGKGFIRLRSEAEGGVVVMCPLEEKEALLSSGDNAFYTTPHYDGYASILVNLDLVDDTQLRELVTEAWRLKAPASLRKAFDS